MTEKEIKFVKNTIAFNKYAGVFFMASWINFAILMLFFMYESFDYRGPFHETYINIMLFLIFIPVFFFALFYLIFFFNTLSKKWKTIAEITGTYNQFSAGGIPFFMLSNHADVISITADAVQKQYNAKYVTRKKAALQILPASAIICIATGIIYVYSSAYYFGECKSEIIYEATVLNDAFSEIDYQLDDYYSGKLNSDGSINPKEFKYSAKLGSKISLVSKEDADLESGIYFTFNKEGDITEINYKYEINWLKTPEENYEEMEKLFSEFHSIVENTPVSYKDEILLGRYTPSYNFKEDFLREMNARNITTSITEGGLLEHYFSWYHKNGKSFIEFEVTAN